MMEKEDKYIIDQVFRDKLADYEKIPPVFVWDNIQASLVSKKRKKRLIYWRISGIAAALAIAFLAGWQFSKEWGPDQRLVVEKTTQIPTEPQGNDQIKAGEIIEPEEFEKQPENTFDKSRIIFLSDTDSEIFGQQIKQASAHEKEEAIRSIRSLQAVLKNEPLKLEENVRSPEEAVFTPEELRIIEENKNLLAMNQKHRDQRKWAIGVAVSPNYSVNHFSHSNEYAKDMAASGDKNNLNLGGGFSFEYKTRKKWSFQSGLYYNKIEQGASNSTEEMYADPASPTDALLASYFTTPVAENNGMLEMNSVAGVIQIEKIPSSVRLAGILDRKSVNSAILSNVSFDQNFEYLEIPLFVKYQVIDSKVGVQVLTGLSTNILVGNDVYLKNDSGKSKVGKTLEMVDFSYSTIFGLGVNYKLTSNLYLNVEPRVKYYLNSLNENSDVSYRPYSFGIYTGVSYSF
jgi:hypothetical protein